jgi:uncharacterized protein YjbJ (UPF0337 family)
MSEGKGDEAKGRVKQAGGDLTGDKDLKREGKVDETTGKTKGKVSKGAEKVSDKAKDVLGRGD